MVFMPFLTCTRCGQHLTGTLNQSDAPGHDVAGQPLVAVGTYKPSWNGGFVLHPKDVTGSVRHHDAKRLTGCCGPSGLDGPNRICSECGAEIGTEESDCWTPHSIVTLPNAVRISTASSKPDRTA